MPVVHDGGANPEEVFAGASRPVLPTALIVAAGGGSGTSIGVGGSSPAAGGDSGASRSQQAAAVTSPSLQAKVDKRTDLPEGFGFRYWTGFEAGVLVVKRWSEGGTVQYATFS
jgi:hypothetical protein